jgi:hypothetical protein
VTLVHRGLTRIIGNARKTAQQPLVLESLVPLGYCLASCLFHLPSVASRTTRRAAWLESSFGEGITSPMASSLGCWNLQWVRKLASTLRSSEAEGFSVIRPRAKTSLQVEQYQTNGVFVASMNDTGINVAMQTVSHSAVAECQPCGNQTAPVPQSRWVSLPDLVRDRRLCSTRYRWSTTL